MNTLSGLRFLRPYLSKDLPAAARSAYIHFNRKETKLGKHLFFDEDVRNRVARALTPSGTKNDSEKRIERLKNAEFLEWPRVENQLHVLPAAEELISLQTQLSFAVCPKMEGSSLMAHMLTGRVRRKRVAGNNLQFIDIIQDGTLVQGVCESSMMELAGIPNEYYRNLVENIRKGDIISVKGRPYLAKSGVLSIRCIELPVILSPCLHVPPESEDFKDPEARIRQRHVDLLVNIEPAQLVRSRSHIIQSMRSFLLDDKFLEVQTPIISDAAGGAVARPFTTIATEFPQKPLQLRIAPELWLKRMVIGGFSRVFEIGPVFRNEGIDKTHNPEFTTCEFYKAFSSLTDLTIMTENMITTIAKKIEELRPTELDLLPEVPKDLYTAPFARIEFVPAVEKGLEEQLPDLNAEDATDRLVSLFERKSLPIPASPTLPRLLDKLSSIYIEPQCAKPTFIMHHPTCLAPLAKSFYDDKAKQYVSARAELFIGEHEIANMYEEENSPFDQREKMKKQLAWRDDENDAHVDESYISALEWGLPPTGGWGCGIDRLVMLLTGKTRISDVLPFGNLRNVVNLGSPAPRTGGPTKMVEAEPVESEKVGEV
ncbi:hypothetical protein BJ875DRAFT_374320 [Amylocarpus encephaloides]|uniref:Lysyl-tRNA synthetase n=1 Tax=Amylocarpus encephaloides TaxID=45428 RepID=A0A9P7YKG7_9HELO|nr:hypothetical protein BJ875DRAFT_374320 [Amylocarpus encephaloides]